MELDLQSRAVKAPVVLDPAALAGIEVPNGLGKVTLCILPGGRTITAEVNTKSLRRCVATIAEKGPDDVAVVLQGKLEAGIAAQPKTPKATLAPAVSGLDPTVTLVANSSLCGRGLWKLRQPKPEQPLFQLVREGNGWNILER